MGKIDEIGRNGWEEMEKEINDKGKNLGGCWLPYVVSSYAVRLSEWLVTVFPGIHNVMDLGSGGGQCGRYFKTLGCQVINAEGLEYAAKRCDTLTIVHDFEKGPLKIANVDLVFSIEFVEHVSNVDAVIDTLCNGKLVAFSHAVTIQTGHHHVNCQEDDYWIKKMESKGYTYLRSLTKFARTLDGTYFGQSGLIFVRDECLDEMGILRGDHI